MRKGFRLHPFSPPPPKVYAKAGVRFLKGSRYGDGIFRWASPDGSSLLAYEEYHYGEGASDLGYNASLTIPDISEHMQEWYVGGSPRPLPTLTSTPPPQGSPFTSSPTCPQSSPRPRAPTTRRPPFGTTL